MEIGTYRKKPVCVEAIKITPENVKTIVAWCGGQIVEEVDAMDSRNKFVGVNIPTFEGVMRGSEGDYIVKGIAGEFYPCKPGIFDATYELVDAHGQRVPPFTN